MRDKSKMKKIIIRFVDVVVVDGIFRIKKINFLNTYTIIVLFLLKRYISFDWR